MKGEGSLRRKGENEGKAGGQKHTLTQREMESGFKIHLKIFLLPEKLQFSWDAVVGSGGIRRWGDWGRNVVGLTLALAGKGG